ncbi:MAG: hypothetical protein ACRDLD_00200, partial [Thermoleophilaceae bacterium]
MSAARGATAVRHEPGLSFWLHYAEREGALLEDAGDHVLALLPETLQRSAELPEEVAVTSDPDVAREDGAVLLIAGHPALERAAATVLEQGDVARAYLPWPGSARPRATMLEARARELIQVAHGRVDAAGEPAAAYLPLLRAGAMIDYAASLAVRFQEQEEAWVDARSGLAPSSRALDVLRSQPRLAEPEARHRVLAGDLERALAGAHAQLCERARGRLATLQAQAGRALESELARADAYYRGAAESIERRLPSAPPDRRPLLEAQIEATRAEHARRRKEIEQEFEPRHEIRPFRLHLVHVPAFVLPVEVRRGARRFPFALVWLPGCGTFADARCPACGAVAGLVAGRERLGCESCTNGSGAAPAPAASAARPVPPGGVRCQHAEGTPTAPPPDTSAGAKAGPTDAPSAAG